MFAEAVIALIHSNAGNSLAVYSALPAPDTTVFPMALDNAFLDVTAPVAILLEAKTDTNFNAKEGFLFVAVGYLLVELYLPDPYTGAIAAQSDFTTNSPVKGLAPTAGAGYLIGEVVWSPTLKPKLRLFDAAHTHPSVPPNQLLLADTVGDGNCVWKRLGDRKTGCTRLLRFSAGIVTPAPLSGRLA